LLATSSGTAVVVAQNGFILANAPGSADIPVSYERSTAKVPVVISSGGGCFPAKKCKP
jgi:hypothetical protein